MVGDSCLETISLDGRHRFIIEDIKKPFTHHPMLTVTIKMSHSDRYLVDFHFLAFVCNLDLCNEQKNTFFIDLMEISFSDLTKHILIDLLVARIYTKIQNSGF